MPPPVADMVLNHAIKDAPRSRQHYDVHHYIPEKREALTRWVKRLAKILGYDPNDVMTAERNGFQGKGPARRLGRQETYRERKARLAAAGRVLLALGDGSVLAGRGPGAGSFPPPAGSWNLPGNPAASSRLCEP